MLQISVISDDMITHDKTGYLGNVSGFVKVKDLDMFAKICLKYHICCGLFFHNKRNLKDFREIWFLQFDFDNGTSYESIVEKLKKYNIVIMASKNHLIDKGDGKGIIPRFHVFLPLAKPIIDAEYYHYLIKKMAKDWDIGIDTQATDATRYMFKHSQVLFKQDDADWNFDPTHYEMGWKSYKMREEIQNNEKTEILKKENKKYQVSFQDRMNAAKKMVGDYIGDAIQGMDGDRTTFAAMCYGVKCGLTDIHLQEFSDWYNINHCKPLWSKKALQHKIKSAKKRVKSGDFYHPNYIIKVIGKSTTSFGN